jgi:hypothetical protein
MNDSWCYTPSEEKWVLLRGSDDHTKTPFEDNEMSPFPIPRYTPVFQSVQQDLFLFGGYTEDRLGKRKLNDAWVCMNSDWHLIPMKQPQGYSKGCQWPGLRYGSMSATDGKDVYVCGGFSDEGDHIDLWRFDMQTHEWKLLFPDGEGVDIPRSRYCAAFSNYDDKLFLFGGRSRSNPKLNFNDLWYFDLRQGKWEIVHDNRSPHIYNIDAKYPGYHAKMSAASVGSHWYIWGGEGLHGHVSDFWQFDFRKMHWHLIQPARDDDPPFW